MRFRDLVVVPVVLSESDEVPEERLGLLHIAARLLPRDPAPQRRREVVPSFLPSFPQRKILTSASLKKKLCSTTGPLKTYENI